MRKTTLTTALLLSANLLFAQSKNPERTNAILRAVEVMNADAAYTTKTLNSEQFLDVRAGESGQVIGYFQNAHLIKMNVRIAKASCITNDKYYFQNDSLIMFYRQERDFPYDENTKTYSPTHAITAMECRYYYDGPELLKMDSKGEPKCSEKASDKQAAEMLATSTKYVKLLKK